jgi:hypothetical protein
VRQRLGTVLQVDRGRGDARAREAECLRQRVLCYLDQVGVVVIAGSEEPAAQPLTRRADRVHSAIWARLRDDRVDVLVFIADSPA